MRDNSAAFGGDRARVTIWGQSAGAISVCAHLVMETCVRPACQCLPSGPAAHAQSAAGGAPQRPSDGGRGGAGRGGLKIGADADGGSVY